MRVLVVGSGASGVHFAVSALRKGHAVTMLDVGRSAEAPVRPKDTLNELKQNLDDPVRYFLGTQFESVIFPGFEEEYTTKYYGFPPSKSNVFSAPNGFGYKAEGFQPLFSFARGGLAEAWTAGVYPFNEVELADFPVDWEDMSPHYVEAMRRIGVNGARDDLSRFFPLSEHLLPPLDLDPHSQSFLTTYERRKHRLPSGLGCWAGRSRVATLSVEREDRGACFYCGRCLWGCPAEALYTPSVTLRECQRYPQFEYRRDSWVNHFEYGADGRVTRLVVKSGDGEATGLTADRFVLAAGTLSSTRIVLESVYRATGERARLTGLMDNRQVLVPFLHLRMIGRPYEPESYQYHQVAVGIEGERPEEYVHGQVTSLTTALAHPILQRFPCDLGTALFLFRNLRASLGIVNLSFHDRRRETNQVTLEGDPPRLAIRYLPDPAEPQTIRRAVRRLRRLLWHLGCVVPPGMVNLRPMGASVHYAGTLPMSDTPGRFTVSRQCRSHDFDNLYVVDGSTFPFLPAKNVTFSLMANAIRVAEEAF